MEITTDPEKGFINKLEVNGCDIINPWGIEAADSASAFRWTEKPLRLKQKFTRLNRSETGTQGKVSTWASEGGWEITFDESMKGNVVTRTHSLEAIRDSYLLDFVTRYRFKKKWFKRARINETELTHPVPFKYYQYPIQQANLFGQFSATVNVVGTEGAGVFEQVMYVTDKKDEWVIHARLLPKRADKYVLKLCTPWYNKAIPDMLAHPFIQNESIRNYLLYRGERVPYAGPWSALAPNIYKLAFVPKGTTLLLKTTCEITKRH